ncbi:MAG: hypothetical protein IJS59_09545 [Bacteroidaceae bacterium]|nr:hypothetical protein [Bacteroidaceae bacterium]
MDIYVLISTIDTGICRVPDVVRAEVADGVYYVVSWQRSTSFVATTGSDDAVARLRCRSDVTLTLPDGCGLCRNRNHAMDVAVGLMSDSLGDAVFVIADDDERFTADAFTSIRSTYECWTKLDVALFRVRSSVDGFYFKRYPGGMISWDYRPRTYYPCSVEMTMRARAYHAGLRFDPRFGLGSEELCAGEEDVFLIDARRKGLKVLIFTADIASTPPTTTGSRELDAKVLRSKGAVYAYERGYVRGVVRGVREALGLGWRHRCFPWRIFREIMRGITYISSWKQD